MNPKTSIQSRPTSRFEQIRCAAVNLRPPRSTRASHRSIHLYVRSEAQGVTTAAKRIGGRRDTEQQRFFA